MLEDPASKGELEIVSEETIQSSVARHGLWISKAAVILSLAIVGLASLAGMVVLISAFFLGRDPPAWATAIESSAVTAALALIFKDHLPDVKETGRARHR